jgi:2-dehydro-3-deoxyglucarate aldolase/4-hydroxy-2-oxoheptanedioate aldolase
VGTRFKDLLAANKLCRIFNLGRVVSPVLIDLFALSQGYHGFWIDQEHGGLTYEQILIASVCARANQFDTIVRMAPTDYARVTQNLEAGSGGVMAARIDSAEQAEQFVQWAKFAPRGSRGFNTSGWDARYTHKPPAVFAEEANREHLVSIQIETLGALEDAEKIAAIDGVDLLFVGPSDLSQAFGHVGQLNHAKVWEAIDRVAAACKQHGKHWGTVPAGPEFAQKCYDKGCRMLSLGADTVCIKKGIEAMLTWYGPMFQM